MLKTAIVYVLAFVIFVQSEFNLTVVHISDFHSHWFEYDENKTDCSRQESKEGKCFGGFPRLLTFVRDIRKKEKNVLILSSGEFFLGRSLHALHGWKLAHALLPRLELDAMSLSNHDFDSGVFELSAFLYAMKFPVLCANMWARNTSFLYSRVNKSAVIDVGGKKIGIVGYIHRHALNKTNNAVSVKFLPEIPALQKEVHRLESEGIDKIIALGHAGYYTDLQIAKEVKGVDIVIGGDSDIMLFEPGEDADASALVGNIHGNYPRIHQQQVEEDNDRSLSNKTLILHIPQHGMYVGVLRATFDDQGKIIHESGEPVLLDNKIPQDKDTLEFLKFAKRALEKLSEHSRLPNEAEILGKTSKYLDGNPRNCRMTECTLGNFLVDAFLHEFTFHYRNKSEPRFSGEQWGPIDAVVLNSGSILHSIEPGFITIQDVLKSVSLGGMIKRVYMSGQQLLHMMEHSVRHYDTKRVTPPGAFLQVAGLKVEYDLNQSPGNRVKSLVIRCRDCGDENLYLPVKIFKTYIIGMPTFLSDGRDGFYDFEQTDMEDYGQFDALLIVEYLRRMYEIEPKLDGRIKFRRSARNMFGNDEKSSSAISTHETSTSVYNLNDTSVTDLKNMSAAVEQKFISLSDVLANESSTSSKDLKNHSILVENMPTSSVVLVNESPVTVLKNMSDVSEDKSMSVVFSNESSTSVIDLMNESTITPIADNRTILQTSFRGKKSIDISKKESKRIDVDHSNENIPVIKVTTKKETNSSSKRMSSTRIFSNEIFHEALQEKPPSFKTLDFIESSDKMSSRDVVQRDYSTENVTENIFHFNQSSALPEKVKRSYSSFSITENRTKNENISRSVENILKPSLNSRPENLSFTLEETPEVIAKQKESQHSLHKPSCKDNHTKKCSVNCEEGSFDEGKEMINSTSFSEKNIVSLMEELRQIFQNMFLTSLSGNLTSNSLNYTISDSGIKKDGIHNEKEVEVPEYDDTKAFSVSLQTTKQDSLKLISMGLHQMYTYLIEKKDEINALLKNMLQNV